MQPSGRTRIVRRYRLATETKRGGKAVRKSQRPSIWRKVVHSRVESCLCVDLLHNLASDLVGCDHQPSAPFLETASFQNVRILPEPLPPTEPYAVRQVLEPVNEARTGRIPPIKFISRTGLDCLANSRTQASAKAECRVTEKRDGLFRRESSHAIRQGQRSPGCADR
jgi:hypothetical protein